MRLQFLVRRKNFLTIIFSCKSNSGNSKPGSLSQITLMSYQPTLDASVYLNIKIYIFNIYIYKYLVSFLTEISC